MLCTVPALISLDSVYQPCAILVFAFQNHHLVFGTVDPARGNIPWSRLLYQTAYSRLTKHLPPFVTFSKRSAVGR